MSQSTGIAPIESMDSKLATKVKVGIMTSSPKPTPADAKATVRAEVPLDTA